LPHLEIVAAENSQFDEVPARRVMKLALSAQLVNGFGAARMAKMAKSDHKHLVLGYPLSVQMNYVVVMLRWSAAHAVGIFSRNPIAIAALCGSHQNGTSSSRSA
jgi:hypothetical protein